MYPSSLRLLALLVGLATAPVAAQEVEAPVGVYDTRCENADVSCYVLALNAEGRFAYARLWGFDLWDAPVGGTWERRGDTLLLNTSRQPGRSVVEGATFDAALGDSLRFLVYDAESQDARPGVDLWLGGEPVGVTDPDGAVTVARGGATVARLTTSDYAGAEVDLGSANTFEVALWHRDPFPYLTDVRLLVRGSELHWINEGDEGREDRRPLRFRSRDR